MPELLIATNNVGKLREIREIIGELPLTLVSLTDVGIDTEITETGTTFEENAAIKAAGYARLAHIPTLADDSGLTIEHLGGRPGVRSARYAGENASDQDRVKIVLAEMENAPVRIARFVCVTALADADGRIIVSGEGACDGMIADEQRGSSGFGYDPIFFPIGFEKTFAELDAETKNRISHRADSLSKIIPFLRGFFNI
jgi:XTP/dITP diphosphohydrolase